MWNLCNWSVFSFLISSSEEAPSLGPLGFFSLFFWSLLGVSLGFEKSFSDREFRFQIDQYLELTAILNLKMKIFVKTLKGTHFEIEVKPQDTVRRP